MKEELKNRTDPQAVQRLFEAAHFAAEKHAQQKRKGAAGEPYINHLIEVAELVAASLSEPDNNLVIAALLHDTIEGTATTKEELIRPTTRLFALAVLGQSQVKFQPTKQ